MRRLVAALACSAAACHAASAQLHVTVDPGPTDRHQTVISTTIPDLRPNVSRWRGTLKGPDGETLPAQIDQLLDDSGTVTGVRLEWVQPALEANHPKTYTLSINGEPFDITPYFHYVDADGYRDLYYGPQPVYRYVNKYDPADHANTFKPFHHVYGFHDEGLITKGPPGGLYPHHRGLFFGFKTPYGDFWHCPDVHQQHTGYNFNVESSGPIAARTASTVDWIAKDGKPVVRDTRDVTAYRVSPDTLVLDYDITVETLTGADVPLTGDPQHAGFHFRAAQEVADQKAAGAKVIDGGATYVRPPTAKFTKNDEWLDSPWVACSFSIKDHPYTILHMDHPSNPTPTTYSTRAYGRLGAFFTTTLHPDHPLHLKYRVVVLDAAVHPNLSQDELAARYADFATPPTVTVKK